MKRHELIHYYCFSFGYFSKIIMLIIEGYILAYIFSLFLLCSCSHFSQMPYPMFESISVYCFLAYAIPYSYGIQFLIGLLNPKPYNGISNRIPKLSFCIHTDKYNFPSLNKFLRKPSKNIRK